MKSIPVSKATWRKLKKIKKKKGFRVLNQVVEYLVDNEENETLMCGGAKEEVKLEDVPSITSKTIISSAPSDMETKLEGEITPLFTPEFIEEARKLNISAEEFIEYAEDFCKRKK